MHNHCTYTKKCIKDNKESSTCSSSFLTSFSPVGSGIAVIIDCFNSKIKYGGNNF